MAIASSAKANPETKSEQVPREHGTARPAEQGRGEPAIVPKDTTAGNALAAVVAIMTFLAAVTSGGVAMIIGTSSEWRSDYAREMTIQVRPTPDHQIGVEVARAAALARATPGISEVRIYTKEESERLLEPWLGPGLSLDELPVPRMIAVKVAAGTTPDNTKLREALAKEVAGASLDDHRLYVDRMRRLATILVAGGVAIFSLVLAATVLCVAFATRGAMASSRPIVEVLNLIGAKQAYIASQFQRRFLVLGLKGGAIGGAAAVGFLALAGPVSDVLAGNPGDGQTIALFGSYSVGTMGYVTIAIEVALIAVVTALASRHVVIRTLRQIG
jgi:cell division transport system permease protein